MRNFAPRLEDARLKTRHRETGSRFLGGHPIPTPLPVQTDDRKGRGFHPRVKQKGAPTSGRINEEGYQAPSEPEAISEARETFSGGVSGGRSFFR